MKTIAPLILIFCITCTLLAKPNVIIVMTDDQGYPELSAHGNPILQTPHLDRLHGLSLRLSNFHVTPMCTPTRGQLLTGIDAAHNGATNVSSGRALLRPELPTIADILKENGYQTGIFGKWHLGDNYPFRPQDRGFQETLWFPSSHIGSLPDAWGNDYFDDSYIHNGKQKAYKGYCTDIFFNEAMRFIKESASAKKPFFAYITPNTPHWPLIAKEQDRADIAQILEKPEFNHLDDNLKNDLSHYLGMVKNIDSNIGQLMHFLKNEKLWNNTILIFLTDNGSTFGPRYFNANMRGMKTELWDGGHRVPCFIHWPAGELIKPQDLGGLTQAQDLLPTILDLCKIPEQQSFDGISLEPALRGETDIDSERMLVINYSRMPGGFDYPSPHSQSIMKREGAAVLWKHWRLLEDRELYNIAKDPLQKINILKDHPEIVAKMRKHLDDWWDKASPTANEPQHIIIGHEKENPTMLTACEWMDVFIDQQWQVRKGVTKNSYWLLELAEDGVYEIELRRWPRELDMPLQKAPEGAVALNINKAKIYISPHQHLNLSQKQPYGFEGLTKHVRDTDKSVTFSMALKKGPIALHTWFETKDGKSLGAYYAYIRRKS